MLIVFDEKKLSRSKTSVNAAFVIGVLDCSDQLKIVSSQYSQQDAKMPECCILFTFSETVFQPSGTPEHPVHDRLQDHSAASAMATRRAGRRRGR